MVAIGIVVFGLVAESAFMTAYFRRTGHHYKEHHFLLSRYVMVLVTPLAAILVVASSAGWVLLNIVVVFAFMGTFLEWLIGWAYHHIVGQRLWTYHRYSIGGYTSLLSVPLWGLCGGLFWLLAAIF